MMFSIIVPMYNVEYYIDECIDSLINQSFTDFEIILINDCSTDNTLIFAKSWKKKDNRVRLIEKENNSGLSDTRNVGINSARGDYIVFVDSDDYIEKDSLLEFSKIIKEEEPDVIYAGFIQENMDGTKKSKYGFVSETNRLYAATQFLESELKKRNLYAAAAFGIYKRELIEEKALFFKVGILHEDEQWTPRIIMNANSIFLSKMHFYHYIKRDGSITTKKDRTQNGIDLLHTCEELEEYSKNHLTNKQLLKLYNNQLAKLYMKAVYNGKLYRNEYKHIVDRFFPFKHACMGFDILKALLFILNLRLYCKLDEMLGTD